MTIRDRAARTVMLAFCACVVVGVPRAAIGQQPGAEALYEEGIALKKAGKMVEAEAKLQASWDVRPSLDTATNLGELELELGQLVEAATHLDYARRNILNSLAPELKKRIQDGAARARAQVGAIEINVLPVGATVELDGLPVGQAPLDGPVFTMPGQHEVAASLAGHTRRAEQVVASAGETARVAMELQPGSVSPPVAHDGTAPVGGWILLGAGAVVAVTGGVLLAVGLGTQAGAQDDVEAVVAAGGRCEPASSGFETRCDDAASSQGTGNALAAIGGIALGVGVAAAVGGVIWLVGSGGETSSVALGAAPVVGPEGAGVWAQGRF